jgi:hypothetical protein
MGNCVAQLQKLSEVIQSQLSRQACKAETKGRTSGSDNGKHKAYVADGREYALSVAFRPAARRKSSSRDSKYEEFR